MTDRKTLQPKYLGMIVFGLVVVAVAAAIITSQRPVADLDPNTPEGAVQGFFRAIEARDYNAAHALLSLELGAECTPADLATYVSDFDRVVIDEVIPSNSSTLVRVEVHHIDATDPLNPSTYTELLDFEIASEKGRPVLSRLPFLFFCEA